MSKPAYVFLVAIAVLASSIPALGADKVIWKLGEPDRSDHEFAGAAEALGAAPLVVRVGSGNALRQWPKFHPGSGNGAYAGHTYTFTLAFDLPGGAPQGVFYLDLSLLFRQPRTPSMEVRINGRTGRYYFDPEPMFELGNGDDQFNPMRSVARRKIALPAHLFKAGENLLALTAVDDPPAVINNRTVGGKGDSGFFYDSLALSQDAEASPEQKLSVSLTPTVFFIRSGQKIMEECSLTVVFPTEWNGGKANIALGAFTTQIALTKPAEFGEGRYAVLVPGDLPAQAGRVELASAWKAGSAAGPASQAFSVDFAPARKWKLYYAPSEHLDIGYTDYRPKVAEVHARVVDDLLNMLDAHPDYHFNLDGSWIAEQWLATRTSKQADRLAAHARAGRIGMNALYASFVTDYPSIEVFFRGLYLSRELQARCGIPLDFAMITDIPGNSGSVPSLLASAGILYFADGGNQDRGPFIVHGHWNARSPFWWEGPDGQRVLTWFSSHYHQIKAIFGLPPAVESGKGGVARFLRTYERANYAPDAVLVYGTEVENLPMDYADASFVQRWNAAYAYPRIIPCRFGEFFQYIEQHYTDRLPVVRGGAGAYWGDCFGMFARATKRDRGNQMRVISAESLAALTCAQNPNLRFPLELDHDIWRNLLLYAEHTYGSSRGGGQPEHDETVGQLNDKEDQTIRAEGDIDKLMRRSLSQLADQVPTEGRNLIVFNSLSWKRSGLVQFMVDAGTVLTEAATGRPVDYEVMAEKDGAQTICFLAADVPALGYKIYPMTRGQRKRVASPAAPAGNVLENRFYRITLEPSRAAIKSLYDKQLGRELVDTSSPYMLNEYLFVNGQPAAAGVPRLENTQYMHPWTWLPKGELAINHPEGGSVVGIEKTPWGQRLRLRASALHTPVIEMEILLPDEVKRIDLRNRIEVDLLREKQASYFAFPWAMSEATFRFDAPSGFVDPEKDLLDGACSEWFMPQHWVSTADAKASVDLAVVDAPLVCLGDVYRGIWPKRFIKSASTVFSQAMSNTWSSKWAGQKSWELLHRYAITSGADFDPIRSSRLGREARCPLEIAEIKSGDKLPQPRGTLPKAEATLVSLEPENLVITALKGAEDGQGLVVRVLEIAGRERDGILKLPFCIVSSAQEATALEAPVKPLVSDASGIQFHLRPHQTLTIRLKVAEPAR